MKQFTSEQIAEMRSEYGIPENFVPVASAPGVVAWGVPVEKIKLSPEQTSRTQTALTETVRLLEKEKSYMPEHQDSALIAFFERHIEKLNKILRGEGGAA